MIIKNALMTSSELIKLVSQEDVNLLILDLRPLSAYETAHIPLAISAHRLFNNISFEVKNEEDKKRFIEIYRELFSSLGLKGGERIVLYTSQNFQKCIVAKKLLELFGYSSESVFILDGGFESWIKSGLKLSYEGVSLPQSSFLVEAQSIEIDACNEIVRMDAALAPFIDFPRFNKEPVFAFNRQGDVIYANVSKEKNLPDIHSLYDVKKALSREYIDAMIEESKEDRSVYLDKKRQRYYAINLKGLSDSNRILAYGFDITKLYKLNKDLKAEVARALEKIEKKNQKLAQQEQAYKEMEAKDLFLANMSHELRTPLNAIMGFIDGLKQLEKDTKKLQYLNLVKENAQALKTIIDNIMQLSKEPVIKKEPTQLLTLFEDIVAPYKVKAEKEGMAFEYHFDEACRACIEHVDGHNLKIVVGHIIDNAIKFNRPKGRIEVRVDKKETLLVVEVKDEGIGIEPKNLEKIFEPFSQEDSSFTRNYQGVGVGLAVCKKLIDAMGGSIEVQSTPKEGSCFKVLMPLEKQA